MTDLEPLPYALVWRTEAEAESESESEAESEAVRALAGIVRDLGPLP
ncbi:hypothetical protein [Nonomuraea salmonea]|uniref:Uncharacterized protein n=1 Tax=Nonomuraea salmonea TaxID=46181 RepID=A0ABV5NGS4_9ACTN